MTLDEARLDLTAANSVISSMRAILSDSLPSEKEKIISLVATLPSETPLLHGNPPRVNSIEFASRLMRLLEVHEDSQRTANNFSPPPSTNRRGWSRGKSPTPGQFSGTRKGSL